MSGVIGFEAFVRAHATELLRSATLLAAGREEGEELLQDTLTHLYPQWDKVKGAEVPVAYVRRVMVNRLISQRRSPRRNEISVAEPPEVHAVRDHAASIADGDSVRTMLSLLPEKQRAATVLRYYHDLPDSQIAQIIGCREVTVRSLVSRALSSMRRDEQAASLPQRTEVQQ